MKLMFNRASATRLALLSSAAVVATATPAMAQDVTDESAVDPMDAPAIIVTGTRQADRSAADTVAPVDIVTGAELAANADTDMGNLLRVAVPSFNVNTQPISDAATLVRPANLRGLSPDNTLVLVNGKRMHRASVITFLGGGIADGSQGPDISTIPTIAIKQLEVLRDGASSQYGSDAIAGVMNFLIKDDREGGTLTGKWGSTYEGDGDNYQIGANIGLGFTELGFINISAEYGESDATSRSVQRDDAAALIAAGNTAVADPAQIWGQPNVNDDFKLFINSGLDLTDNLHLYAFGNYASRNVDGGFFFRNPTNRGGVYAGPMVDPTTGFASSASNAVPSVLVGDLSINSSGDCVAGIPLTQGGLIPDPTILAAVSADPNCFSFVEMFPGGFTPRFGGSLEDVSVAGGLRGQLFGGLDFDVSYRYGRNEVDFVIRNTVNASLGPNTPNEFKPGGYQQEEQLVNLDLGYEIPVGAGSVYVAAGAEYREETFTIQAGDAASFALGPLAQPTAAYPTGQGFSTSSNGFGGFSDNAAGSSTEDNKAVYLDIEADLIDALTLQGAVRYEDTKSFGNTTTWKLGALYRLSDALRVRGTYSTGFHVPTAGQANVINVTTQFSGGQLQDEGTFPLFSPAGLIVSDYISDTANGGLGLARPTLGPEKSDSFTVGLAGDFGDITFTLDYFNIKLKDRISRSSTISFPAALCYLADRESVATACPADLINDPLPRTADLLVALDGAGVIDRNDFTGFEDLTAFAFFNNAFDTRTQGVDFVANARLYPIPGGTTRATLAVNYTHTKVLNADSTISDTRIRQLEENLPQWKGFLNLTHDQGRFRGMLRANYFGSFYEAHLDDGTLPIDAGARVTLDAELGYELFDGFELAVGAQNLLDTYPERNPYAGIAGAEYAVTSPFGFSGGTYYIRGRFQF
ncbi:TonB-dependent receptor, Iron siderophore receptor protein [Altererythrobacter epoxidivorans]|uniref:TonB-dependent receptor, Iron siderophore receptor protein n=1 Tax=Altererythrobacter epoxidivorans TaxID=361183 RepID=A0A0M4LX15_9SPHN|nr:TonB-dependent receptor [Altererythrobacter epoxidivorans]ALE17979.1 TonB-dependent receptor, Iron siderophore receptor protein [Altererythrobacter epoxidivorans]